jgi:plastocyanin
MDPKKSRRWVIPGLAAATGVFLVMAGGEVTATAQQAVSTATTRAEETVLASDSGAPSGSRAAISGGGAAADAPGPAGATGSSDDTRANDDTRATGTGATDDTGGAQVQVAERNAIVEALLRLLDALGISPQELADEVGAAVGEAADRSGNGAGTGSGRAGNEQADPADAPAASITIADFAFGRPVTVAPGATVEVQNNDSAPHNVTADDGSFATENIAAGGTTAFTAPSRPGRYAFACTLHPEMTGTLIVQETGTRTGNGGTGAGAGGETGASGRSVLEDEQDGASTGGAGRDGAARDGAGDARPAPGTSRGTGDGY